MEIAKCVGTHGISEPILRKHFRRELNVSLNEVRALAMNGLVQGLKKGEAWAVCFTLKARAGWHKTSAHPMIPSGHFYDSFTRNRSIYKTISISAFDTPNPQHVDERPLTAEEPVAMSPKELAYCSFPSLITREWVAERFRIWGPKHPKYVARVLGEFPSDDSASVFPLSGIERARREFTAAGRAEAQNRNASIQVGIDVAGAGADETVLIARVGGMILGQRFWSEPNPRGAVMAELSQIQAGKYRLPLGTTVVDTVGIGYNFALHLADHGFNCYGFNSGARGIDNTQFANQKAEAHWSSEPTCRTI
jgi:hypothetical protein